ncbi:MAG: hypothetical protein JO102_06025 [Elusimicrobia bacterium]|nr:hypothetical protein [Elusimicrobiota bacterium]
MTPEEFKSLVAALRGKLVGAVRHLDADDGAKAAQMAHQAAEGIDELLKVSQRDLVDALTSGELADTAAARRRLDELLANPTGAAGVPELVDITARLMRDVSRAESLLKPIFAPRFNVMRFLGRRSRVIGGIVAAVAAAGLLFWISVKRSGVRHGLTGFYYAGTEFTEFYRQRRDAKIDFDWSGRAPFRGWKKTYFSVRWSGYLLVPAAGRFEFYVHADDGVRFWIGDKLLIDEWTSHPIKVANAGLTLLPGYYPIKVEYFQGKKKAVIRLFWRREVDVRPEVIPAKYLVPSEKYLDPSVKVIQQAGPATAAPPEDDNENPPEEPDEQPG